MTQPSNNCFSFPWLAATLALTGTLVAAPAHAQKFELQSPDQNLTVAVDAPSDGAMTYRLTYKGQTVVAPSALGIVLDGQNLGQKARMQKPVQRSVNEKYNAATYGVHTTALNQYQFAAIPLTSGTSPVRWTLELRVYNDGMAYRYRVPGQGTRHVDGEASIWNIPTASTLWYQSDRDKSYEAPYVQAGVGSLAAGATMMAPAAVKLPGTLGYALMTEANLVNYSDMSLEVTAPGTFKALFTNDRQGWNTDGEIVSPWRTTVFATNLNTLVNSDLIKNLCPPPAKGLAGAKWIKPGRSSWQWLYSGGPRFAEQKQWVDATKAMGFEYYLIDDGWRDWNDGGKSAWENLKSVVDYAKSQGVEVFAWVNSNEVFSRARRLAYLEKAKAAGVVGLKIDFPGAANVEWVNWYEDTLRDTAQFQLLVDFHGALKPTGRERTWPHELTREAIRGRENGKHSPIHDNALPFLRYVQGPADFTPAEFRADRLTKSSYAHELAQAVVYTSPFLCYGGPPQMFLTNPARDLIKAIPATWDETVVLPGSEIGQLTAFARRKGDDWFIAVLNGADAKTMTLPLSFLGKGDYQIAQYADSQERPDAWTITNGAVKQGAPITFTMRPGGGYLARITKMR